MAFKAIFFQVGMEKSQKALTNLDDITVFGVWHHFDVLSQHFSRFSILKLDMSVVCAWQNSDGSDTPKLGAKLH